MESTDFVKKVNVGIIGNGLVRRNSRRTCAHSPYVGHLHLAEIKEERLAEVAAKTKPASTTSDYRTLLQNPNIDGIIISATPETTHYPMAAQGVTHGFSRFAIAVTPVVAVSMLLAFGWRSIFYVFRRRGTVVVARFFCDVSQSSGRTPRREPLRVEFHSRRPVRCWRPGPQRACP